MASTSDKPPAKILAFERPRRFPADLVRLRTKLDDASVAFEESDLDEGFACAEAAIARGVPGGHEAHADLMNVRAHRSLAAGDADAALAAWAALISSYPTDLRAYVMRARILGQRGDHAAALAELNQLVERSPTEARGYLLRASFYRDRGDGERALANFRRAAQLDRTSSEALLGVAQALAATGDTRGAARAYAQAAEEVLGDAESYNLRGLMHFLCGQDELALADYEASVALSPNDPDTIAWRGLCRLRLNRYDGAIADFTRLISMRPREARGYRRRGEALVRTGRPAEALRDLDCAVALGGEDRGAAHFARGMAQQALGDVAAALSSYDAAIELDPGSLARRVRRFQIHNDAEDWPLCQIDADAMLASVPDSPSLLLTHARLCVRNGRPDDARASYDGVIALEPENAGAYHERSVLQAGRGETTAARADLTRAFELAPDDLGIRAARGRDQAQTATTEEERAAALGLIASSAELDADNHEAWARAAHHFRYAGQPGEALRCITRAIELDPDNAEHLDERATCLECAAPARWLDPVGFRTSLVAALADAERAIALSSDGDLERYRRRANLLEDLGDLEGAIADQTRLIELAPEVIDAYIDRARLRKLTGDLPGARADAARVTAMEDELLTEFAAFPEACTFQRFNLDEV
jgi:tetratricopeptide (TPR) repeat protein